MSEQEKQESQKTIVAFAAGLLIGGLLVWIFGGSPKQEEVKVTATTTPSTEVTKSETATDTKTTPTKGQVTTAPKAVLITGEGKVEVGDIKAGNTVALTSATFPTDEGWIVVRDSNNGQISGVLGAARYSKEQGLVPQAVTLERPTISGKTYAIVFYNESGDRKFTQADDKQIDTVAPTIFTAK